MGARDGPGQPVAQRTGGSGHDQAVLRFTRVWLPVIVVVGGVLAIVVGRDLDALEGGAGIIGAGLSIWLLNLLHRIGVSGDHDRTDEDAARTFFDAHGHWPDEAPPPREPPRSPHRQGPPSRPRTPTGAAPRRPRRP